MEALGRDVDRLSRFLEDELEITVEEDDEFVTSNDSTILRETFRLYGSIYLVSFVLYSFLRLQFPKLFNIRSWVPEHECELAKKEYRFFSWFWEVFKVEDDDIMEQCGMDALCFIRAMRLGRRLSYVGCFVAAWLIPLYRTAKECDETSYLTDPFVRISISNLCSSSPRFAGTVVAAYIVFGYTMYLLIGELQWYTHYRHEFLSSRAPRNYSIYVSGIPSSYRSSSELFNYFQNCTKGAVLEAQITMNIPNLEAKHARRQVVVEKLEHAVALERKTGKTETHRRCGWHRGVEQVQSVADYEYELGNLNSEIDNAVKQIMNKDDPMRSQFARDAGCRDVLGAIELSGTSSYDEEATDIHILPRKHTGAYEYDNEMADLLAATPRKNSSFHANSSESPSSPRGSPRSHRKTLLPSSPPLYDASCSSVPDELDELFDPEVGESSEGPDFPGLQSVAEEPLLNTTFSTESHLSRENGGILDEEKGGLRKESSNQGVASIAPDDGLSTMTVEPESDLPIPMNGLGMENEQSERSTWSSWQNESQSSNSSTRSRHAAFRTSLSSAKRSAGKSIAKGSKAATQSIRDGTRAASQSLAAARHSIVAGSKAAQDAVIKATKEVPVNIEKITKTAEEVASTSIKKAQVIGSQVVSSAGAVVPLLLNQTEGSARTAGFVVFYDLYSVQSALQMLHHPKPYTMEVQEAPDPGDIFWRNVGLPNRSRRVGRAFAITASAVLCFFWSVPTAFIASLTEISSLKEELPKLGAWIDDHPRAQFFFEQIAPLLLLFTNEVILPSVLKHFAKWEGHVSAAMLEASLFVKLGVFMIIQTFFVSAISGGISAELTNILEKPSAIIDLLANSLPAQSSYFMQILLASTFLLQAVEFLRAYQLGLALVRRFIGPNLTKKERRKTWGFLNSLEDPPEFWHAETFAQILLYFVVFLVYATIAPVTSFFLCFCFILLESGYRFQFIHNYPRAYDTGGKLYYSFIQFTLASIIIAQLTVVGLLILKQNKFAGPALGPLIAITIIFIMFVNQKHSIVPRFLPSRDCVVIDLQNEDNGIMDFSFVENKYVQPALQNKRVVPEYDSD